jgi:CheY-like chemotaxis protein
MAKPYRLLREKTMSPESRARSEARAKEILRDMPLDELREARELTQEHLAKILHRTQASISKMERRTDMYVSTLQDFVKALGGELEIRARFPDGEIRINQFSRLATTEAVEPGRAKPRRVLVVEEETETRALMEGMLTGIGYGVDTANDGVAALKRVAEEAGVYGLILSALQMPHLDGRALVEILRDRYGSSAPAVVLMGDPAQIGPNVVDCLGTPVLRKPLDQTEVRLMVERVLAGAA